MAHKLWEKNFEVNKEIESFTVGGDRELDLYLAKYDVLGSMAHITMLESIGLLEKDELTQLLAEPTKAAPAYIIAKDIIHAILCLQDIIAKDPVASKYIQVV